MTPIGFIGLGNMGGALARRLIRAGEPLLVCDLDRGRTRTLVDLGAAEATSPAELADKAELIFACLPSVEASLSVCEEVAQGTALRTYVETSTIGRDAIRDIARILGARGIELLDAPVSGGPKGADAGTLAMIVAGAPATVTRVRPVLEILAAKLFVVGEEPGLAQICKIVNNAISMSAFVLSCEAIVMGVKAGVDAATLVDFINVSTGRNSATVDKIPKAILPRTFDYGAPLGGGVKDLGLYVAEASALGLPSWSVSNILQFWTYANARLDPAADFTTLIKCFEEWAGVEVKSTRRPA